MNTLVKGIRCIDNQIDNTFSNDTNASQAMILDGR